MGVGSKSIFTRRELAAVLAERLTTKRPAVSKTFVIL
jgi:hypothetical protein